MAERLMTKAVVFDMPLKVSVREVPLGDPTPDDLVIRTTYSGISIGTETWALKNRYKGLLNAFPQIPGYQRCGIVDWVGENVKDLKVGDRVFVRGRSRLAPEANIHPASWCGHMGLSVTPRTCVYPLPDGTDDVPASLAVLAAVGCLGVKMAKVQKGETVVVFGQGLIGQMSAQAAKRCGATVFAFDLVPLRAKMSRLYSADFAFKVSEMSPKDALAQQGLEFADVVVDTTGKAEMFDTCLELIRQHGRIVLQGYYPDPIVIDFHETHIKRAAVFFPCGWDGEDLVAMLHGMVDGTCQMAPLITHVFAADDAPQAYEVALNRPEECLGIVLKWT